jgi:hypothetical protein
MGVALGQVRCLLLIYALFMSKLSTNQTTLSGKTSKMVLLQEAAAGGNTPLYQDPDHGFVLINSVSGQVIRFQTQAALIDFLNSTGPNGRWPV